MTEARTHRPIPLVLTTLIAAFSALVAIALSGGGHDAHAHGIAGGRHVAHATPGLTGVTVREFALRQEMRRLWEDHVTWTRLAVISLTGGTPDTDATVARLLRNQTDIGNAIKPYYGRAAGAELTRLLREHITIAADLIGAAKGNDEAKLASEQSAWAGNADRIARFLSRANPESWPFAATRAMLHDHLRLTTREVVARLEGNWVADVRAYDAIHRQALHMADMLSAGIMHQFPGRFR